jgi:hypothetical protein
MFIGKNENVPESLYRNLKTNNPITLTGTGNLDFESLGKGYVVAYSFRFLGNGTASINGFPLTQNLGMLQFSAGDFGFLSDVVNYEITGSGTLYVWYTTFLGFYNMNEFKKLDGWY